tara:strand:+ start:572 stop:736 length:165 start_codon:yes stop_codon:yes gene_type:complete
MAKKKETKKKGRTFTRLLHPETGKSYVVFTPTDEGEKKKLKRRAKLDRYWESLM